MGPADPAVAVPEGALELGAPEVGAPGAVVVGEIGLLLAAPGKHCKCVNFFQYK